MKKETIKKRMAGISIKFSCVQCGKCCRVGFVYLKSGEAKKIADFLSLSLKEFKKQYTMWFLWQGRTLKWTDEGSCIFLKNNKCSIYSARPFQCSSFPIWPGIIKNKRELNRVKKYCKGL